MRLTPAERDRVLIASVAAIARRRLERGLALNLPEATALISDEVIEAARDGVRLAEAVERARGLLGPGDVLPGVAEVLTEVAVEAVFDDGTRLAVVPHPIPTGDVSAAGQVPPGAVLAADTGPCVPDPCVPDPCVPGPRVSEVPDPAEARPDAVRVLVRNESTVPITVTSHWHFFEANPRLRFDRPAAYGRRLAVPAGQGVRFAPGTTTAVDLVPFGGRRVLIGFAGLVDGELDDPAVRTEALRRLREFGYAGSTDAGSTDAGQTGSTDGAR